MTIVCFFLASSSSAAASTPSLCLGLLGLNYIKLGHVSHAKRDGGEAMGLVVRSIDGHRVVGVADGMLREREPLMRSEDKPKNEKKIIIVEGKAIKTYHDIDMLAVGRHNETLGHH